MYLSESARKRFWAKVDTSGDCWLWTGCMRGDYGEFRVGSRTAGKQGAHRIAYWIAFGPDSIPDGMVIRHKVCSNSKCVRSAHLKVGTHGDNVRDTVESGRNVNASKTHCLNNHPYSGTNLYVTAKGSRKCRACHRIKQASYRKAAHD